LKSGSLANFIPNNVIEGMLAGIGISIFLKQLPHAFGYDKDFEGDDSFWQPDGENTFSEIFKALDYISIGALTICIISLLLLLLWDKFRIQDKIKFMPGALVAVVISILLNIAFQGTPLEIKDEHLVNLPEFNSLNDFINVFVFPDFSAVTNYQVWVVAATIAIVASVESLLCIEAADRLDPQKRYSDPNNKLKAQGLGNILSGLIGGLPMTSVVVRSSANINAGAKTKLSAIIHGIFLLISVISIPFVLNKIPLATLAAVLLLIGYKLASPKLFIKFFKLGWLQFLPFIITIIGVVAIDLLKGVLLGLFISIIIILKGNLKKAYSFDKEEFQDGDKIIIKLAQEVSFLNKAAIKESLQNLPKNITLIIDATETVYIDHDVIELIEEFCKFTSEEKNIKVKLKGFDAQYNLSHHELLNNITIKHKS
jgi:MFS superfamily sulfate permease-like transporter